MPSAFSVTSERASYPGKFQGGCVSDRPTAAGAWGKQSAEKEAFLGELHLHTALSADAYMNGTWKHPFTAYRFAQGDPVVLQSGESWSLPVPLDFVAVTDHAESFGDLPLCTMPGSPSYDTERCAGMRGSDPIVMGGVIGGWKVAKAERNAEVCGAEGGLCIEASRATWKTVQDAANRANRPGEFTALVGYEYSPVILDATATSKVHRTPDDQGTRLDFADLVHALIAS